jgi:hypothetical protein
MWGGCDLQQSWWDSAVLCCAVLAFACVTTGWPKDPPFAPLGMRGMSEAGDIGDDGE